MQFIQEEIQVGTEPSAKLNGFLIDNSQEIDPNRQRPAIVICPGGGYAYTSDREAEPVALAMLAAGFQAFVLRYSVAPVRYPVALHQLAKSVAFIRDNAQKLHVDPDKIVVAGFSAGGHLAACLGVFWHTATLADIGLTPAQMQPNGLFLGYPVITTGQYGHQESFENLLGPDSEKLDQLSLEQQVNSNVPETFIWHTGSDHVVPMENSLLFVQALRKQGISFEYHVFPEGKHGASLANSEVNRNPEDNRPEVAIWPTLFKTWVHNRI
ncbi:alpha/beta hydrolase [Agrilactobacillus yilanensis]|uniref:Alpha/beta hydrolase n=1 Tax=Agrilactobacillus yilanensis TaxID=2485997 RepID=A0ABW4J5R6_9LACO|nr:alpha/beta hydrolase [Agrilactobacillus yilanensis]